MLLPASVLWGFDFSRDRGGSRELGLKCRIVFTAAKLSFLEDSPQHFHCPLEILKRAVSREELRAVSKM